MDSIWIGKMLSSFKILKDKRGVTSASPLFCGTKAQHIGKYCTCMRLFEWECRASKEVPNLELALEQSQFSSVSVHCLLTYDDSGQWKWSLKQQTGHSRSKCDCGVLVCGHRYQCFEDSYCFHLQVRRWIGTNVPQAPLA